MKKIHIRVILKVSQKTHVLVGQSCAKLIAMYMLKSVGTPTFGAIKGRHLTLAKR